MNNILRIGLIGFGITLVLNLLGIFVFKKPAAEFFADDWWSTWFPSLAVWLVFTIVGIGLKLSGKNKKDKSDAPIGSPGRVERSIILHEITRKDVVKHYLKSELARIFEQSNNDDFWKEFDISLNSFLGKGDIELERLVAALSSLYRENAGLYRRLYDKEEPSTRLPHALPPEQQEHCQWYFVELPVDELKFPIMPPKLMEILELPEVQRDVRKFMRWVQQHSKDPRIQNFLPSVSKRMIYKEIIAVFKPLDEHTRNIDFWIIDGVHRLIATAWTKDWIPMYLGVPRRNLQEWQDKYNYIIGKYKQ